MPRNAVTDWDIAPANNSDIAGINIAEGCPAGGINDAIRTMMAQLATWAASAAGPLLKSGGAVTGAITGLANGSSVIDGSGAARGIGYRNVPLTNKSSGYVIASSDVGQGISTSAGVTVPANATVALAIGDTIALYNNSAGTITITQASGVTLRLAGSATTGNRTLAQRGLATLIKIGTDEWVISGMGVA
ncbi:MAG TPA: hypothetical protein VNT42_05190 [Sphingomonas sp.]|nr:hypothetical protein [Sphingomonas sp.]